MSDSARARTVAVIGASGDPAKYGNKAVRAYLRQGWTVYPITPMPDPIEGLTPFRSILDVPGDIDRATIYLPPEIGIRVLSEIARKGVGEFYVNPGAESDALLEEARRLGLDPIVACSIVAIGERP
ncbi:MAG: CoA-binding protein [Phycisphaerae bacterium]|nr:CoA-binding protein [Phycisphaerae bacterium]NUQ46197.1 CoA-binding protein [Phycisphaerae bacterium]